MLIANEEDLQATLGIEVHGVHVAGGKLDVEAYRAAAERVSTELGVKTVAITLRESQSASDNGWSAVLWEAGPRAFHQSQRYDVRIVDRIGGGDSFAGRADLRTRDRTNGRTPRSASPWPRAR